MKDESNKNQYSQFPITKSMNSGHIRLIKGVRCNLCGKIGMLRSYGHWECSCGNKEKYAHIPTLQGWFIFNKDTITNRECRDYLMINDRHLAKRLLKHPNIIEFGHNKGTFYKWKWK